MCADPLVIYEKDYYKSLTGGQLYWIQGHLNFLSVGEIVGRFNESRECAVRRAIQELREGKIVCR